MGAICSCFKGKKKEEGMKDIKRNRSCTDSIFCILFSIALVVAAIIIIVGMSNGNIESLYYGTDSTGMTCGSQNNNLKTDENHADLTETKRIVYPRLMEDMLRQSTTVSTDPNDYKFYGVCVPEWCQPAVHGGSEWPCGGAASAAETRRGCESCE